ISFDDRTVNWPHKQPSIYIDGVDFLIREEHPFNRHLFSSKMKHAALRFIVGTAPNTSAIVCLTGGVPCGAWPDLKLAQATILKDLPKGEMAAADKGFRGDPRVMTYIDGATTDAEKRHNQNIKNMKARHDTVNKRLKDFRILQDMSRTSIERYRMFVLAVAQVVNIKIQREPLFSFEAV
ncbi:hypothetical protein HDU76_008741, partial [Blyttiomyces sp. JEL0837]